MESSVNGCQHFEFLSAIQFLKSLFVQDGIESPLPISTCRCRAPSRWVSQTFEASNTTTPFLAMLPEGVYQRCWWFQSIPSFFHSFKIASTRDTAEDIWYLHYTGIEMNGHNDSFLRQAWLFLIRLRVGRKVPYEDWERTAPKKKTLKITPVNTPISTTAVYTGLKVGYLNHNWLLLKIVA
jgi:hypothetical protein